MIILAKWLTNAPSQAGARRSIFTGDIMCTLRGGGGRVRGGGEDVGEATGSPTGKPVFPPLAGARRTIFNGDSRLQNAERTFWFPLPIC